MKSYYGNYLGLVISGGNKDPEGRGRCQVFIPNIMPALYEEWNKEGSDIQFDIVGEGLPAALSPTIVERLKKMLPWAECAAPITGTSPSTMVNSSGQANETLRNIGTSTIGGLSPVVNVDFGNLSSSSRTPGNSQAANASNVRYALEGRSRKVAVDPKLERLLGETAKQVYGSSAQVTIYSGSNSELGRAGTTRHDNGQSADVYISVGGNRLRGDALAPMIQAWLGNRNGSVGHGMADGGTHLDLIGGRYGRPLQGNESNFWTYGGGVTEKIAAAKAAGLKGELAPGTNFSGEPWPTADANMKPDPTKETGQYEGGVIDRSQLAKNNFGGSTDIENFTVNEIRKQGLDKIPVNKSTADKYFGGNTQPSAEQWTNVFSRLSYKESGWKSSTQYREAAFQSNDPTTGDKPLSTGLYQISQGSVRGYASFVSGDLKNKIANATTEQLKDPYFNTQAAIAIMKQRLQVQGGAIESNKTYWSQLRPNNKNYSGDFVAGGTNPNESAQIAAATNQPAIQNPTEFSGTTGHPTNYQANGMFGYASEGTAVWCFFREGNPLFPVYFAASFGQREWQNHYQYASPGLGAGDGGAIPGTEASVMNSYGGGFKSIQVTEDSGLEPQFVFQLFGKNGSNMTFLKDHTELNSSYDLNIRTLGDSHDVTHANKEIRVQGDYNTYAEQDVYITVGNWSEEAIAASDEIQQYLNEAMEIKSQAGSSSAGGGGRTYNPTKSPTQISQQQEAAKRQLSVSARQAANSNRSVQRLNSSITRGDRGNIQRITDQYT